jgi:hypothetical protein
VLLTIFSTVTWDRLAACNARAGLAQLFWDETPTHDSGESANVWPRWVSTVSSIHDYSWVHVTTGYATASPEGKIEVEYFDPSLKLKKRNMPSRSSNHRLDWYRLRVACQRARFTPHIKHLPLVSIWDHKVKQWLSQYQKYKIAISSIGFNLLRDEVGGGHQLYLGWGKGGFKDCGEACRVRKKGWVFICRLSVANNRLSYSRMDGVPDFSGNLTVVLVRRSISNRISPTYRDLVVPPTQLPMCYKNHLDSSSVETLR